MSRILALGDNEFGGSIPFVSGAEGTPFAVVVIPVDDRLAIEIGSKRRVQ